MSTPQLRQAWELYQQSRYALAMDYATRARGAGADPSEALQCVSLCLTSLERHDEAITTAREALREDPSRAWAYHPLGYAYYHKAVSERPRFASLEIDESTYGRLCKAAEGAYREAIRLDPTDAMFHEMLGAVLAERDRFDEAEAELLKALELDPSRDGCLSMLSGIAAQRGDQERAEVFAERALAANPAEGRGHAALAQAGLTRRSTRSSTELFREALRLNPDDAHARRGLIEAMKTESRWIGPLYRWVVRTQEAMIGPGGKRVLLVALPVLVLLLAGVAGFAGGWRGVGSLLVLVVLGCGFAVIAGLYLPHVVTHLRIAGNAVLLLDARNRRVLTTSQRCGAVAWLGYPAVLMVGMVLRGVADNAEVAWWVGVSATWCLGGATLIGPIALWAGALTTRWAWPAGLFMLACAGVFVIAMLSAEPFGLLRGEGPGFAALIVGVVACFLVPDR